MTIFFTSDHHFNHKNIIEYCNRPYSTVWEMNNDLVNKWNSRISQKDEVYYLGDFTFGLEDALAFGKVLNGKIYFIEGNHDSNWYGKIKKFNYLPPMYTVKYYKTSIVLCHYPMRSWNKSFHGSLHLFGHEHGRMPPLGNSFDVGVDCWDGYPIAFDEVLEYTNQLKYNNK